MEKMMLINTLFFLAIFVVVIAIYISRRPDEFKTSRSIVINTDKAVPFEHVNDLVKWRAWSPWAELDPDAKNIFEGPDSGVGASLAWDGNKKVGAGKMEIIESRLNEFIKLRLDFLRPMKSTSTTEFEFEPAANQTKVTWSMYGKNNYMAKAISVIMNCEAIVGKQFEKGLEQLKAVCENTGTR